MGWECHWVWKNVLFSQQRFTRLVTLCLPRAPKINRQSRNQNRTAFHKSSEHQNTAEGRPVLVAALPLWVSVVKKANYEH